MPYLKIKILILSSLTKFLDIKWDMDTKVLWNYKVSDKGKRLLLNIFQGIYD